MPSRQFKLKQKITAKVVNSTKHTLTYCVGTGPWHIGTGGSNKIELISSPFGVWRKSENGKWGILLTGIDMGSSQRLEDLDPGQSREFWFKLSQSGKMRLNLEYWFDDSGEVDCSDPNPIRKFKKVKSQVFTVYQQTAKKDPGISAGVNLLLQDPGRPS